MSGWGEGGVRIIWCLRLCEKLGSEGWTGKKAPSHRVSQHQSKWTEFPWGGIKLAREREMFLHFSVITLKNIYGYNITYNTAFTSFFLYQREDLKLFSSRSCSSCQVWTLFKQIKWSRHLVLLSPRWPLCVCHGNHINSALTNRWAMEGSAFGWVQGRTLSGQSASEITGNWGPTLGGMLGITTETPSVSNHNKAICPAERKKG